VIRFRALAACLVLLSLLGCSANKASWFGGSTTITTTIDPGINQNLPIAVEVVIVYDAALFEKLRATSASSWFQGRPQLVRDYPEGFVSLYREWVPGQDVDSQELSFSTGARGGLVYANYLNNKENRVLFDPHQDIKVHLSESTFTVDPVE
jgi:type VI secretion system protein